MIMWAIVECTRYCLCGLIFYLGYIMLRDGISYGGWMLVIAVLGLLLGGYKFSASNMATCPKCGHCFEIKKDNKNADTQTQKG